MAAFMKVTVPLKFYLYKIKMFGASQVYTCLAPFSNKIETEHTKLQTSNHQSSWMEHHENKEKAR